MFLNNLDYQVMIGQRAFRASFSKGPAGPGEYGLVQVACTRQTSQAPAGARNMQIVMFLCDWRPLPSGLVAPAEDGLRGS